MMGKFTLGNIQFRQSQGISRPRLKHAVLHVHIVYIQ